MNTPQELDERLSKMPARGTPDTRTLLDKGDELPEMVNLNNIAGGNYINPDHEAPGTFLNQINRGKSFLFDLTQSIAKGEKDIAGAQPIRLAKINGEYFVTEDGHHRVSALKALGVPFAPMLVTHYKSKA